MAIKSNSLILLLIFGCGVLMAESDKYITVYKWTDDKNETHYAENPSPDYPSTTVEVLAETFNSGGAAPKPKPKVNGDDEIADTKAQFKKTCDQATANYEILKGGITNVMTLDADGKPQPMSPEAQEAEREKSKRLMDYYCANAK